MADIAEAGQRLAGQWRQYSEGIVPWQAMRLDALEQEAEEKGGVQQALADNFAKVY